MRIAHVAVEIVPSGPGAYVGGLVKNLATIAEAQAVAGHDVDIITTDIRGRGAANGRGRGFRVRPVRTMGEYGSFVFAGSFVTGAARELTRAHRMDPYDVVHVHSAYASLAGIRYALSGVDAPSAFTLYSPNFGLLPGHSCNGSFLRNGDRVAAAMLHGFDRTAVPSHSLRARLLDMGLDGDRVSIVPPALDPGLFGALPEKEAARPALWLPPDVPVLLYLGNFSTWKGVHDLLRAIEMVLKAHPEAILLTAWGEPYEWSGNVRGEILDLMDRLGVASAVRQVGILDDVRLALRAADILVSPFHCTCKVLDYPLSILEAMACERAVISTSVGGIPEVLGDGDRGVLVPPRDPTRLAGAITELLDDPVRARIVAARGAEWALARFRPDLVNEALQSLYRELREGPRPGDAHPIAIAR